jgi:drug/metabolite transporter (DMT)-like permease
MFPKTTADDTNGFLPLLAYLTICVVWGSTFVALRMGVQTIPPWTMIGLRCLLAGLPLIGFALYRGARLPGPRALASAAASGVLMFTGSQALLAWAELRVPSGQAAVLTCMVSLLTPTVTWMMGAADRPSLLAVAGLILGIGGVGVLAHPDGHATNQLAVDAVLLSTLCWAVGAAIARKIPPAGSALLGSGLQLVAGGPGALAMAWVCGEWTHLDIGAISTRSILAMFYLVVMGSIVAFGCFSWLVQIWKPERLSTYAFINPLVAFALGAAFLGESVGLREVAATALILAAVALVMLGNRGVRKSMFFFEKKNQKTFAS